MPEVKNDHINFRMSVAEKEDFYRACFNHAVEPSQVLRRMMRDYQSGKIKYDVTQIGASHVS